ncbi:MAG TPA: bifunctional UDP-sugar hydrolase/5'-nucleotidase [Bryobacteraceae bacterium]|nr:bifunctional UDP-sugar hydrolase/5'-nucleotidase [Bryobacteraceae bacterium]
MTHWMRRALALSLLLCASLPAEVRSLTIIHTNDLHARLTPLEDHHGGFAYVAAVIRRERAHCTDCLVLFAGDLVQGSPVSTIFHGLPVYQIANLFGFDAATLGNHEFDYGWPQARTFMQIADFPTVTANLVNSRGQLFTRAPYVMLKANGLRVAVIGAMTGTLPSLTTPKLLGDWHTTPLIETVRQWARELKSRSDLIVLLAHITDGEELEVLKNVPEIPVLVTGHIHRGIEQPLVVDGRIMVRAKAYGEEVGRLDLKVDTEKKAPIEWKWTRITVDPATIQPAPDVAAQVQHWESEVTARVDRPLAFSKHAFTKVETKHLIEQALRDETGADFSWMNLGGVRDLVPQGQLLERNIWNIMPFDNTVVVGTFKGKDLPKVVVGDRQIDPNREYTLAVSDYTAANQGTRENLQTTGLQFPHEVGLMRDLLIDWFRKKKIIE